MEDLTHKKPNLRVATARAEVSLGRDTLEALQAAREPFGHVLEGARAAAVLAAKNTWQIVPYCHPLPLLGCGVEFEFHDSRLDIRVTTRAVYVVGVEMECLTGAAAAALSVFHGVNRHDPAADIAGVHLERSEGRD